MEKTQDKEGTELTFERVLEEIRKEDFFSLMALRKKVNKEDIKTLCDAFVKTKDTELIKTFVMIFNGLDGMDYAKTAFGDVLEDTSFIFSSMGGGDPNNSKNSKKTNSDAWLNNVINTQDAREIYFYALDHKTLDAEDIKDLSDAEAKTGNGEYIMQFASYIPGADLDVLARGLKDALDIYLFARDVNGADINFLCNAVIATDDVHSICAFAKGIKGADIKVLQNAVVNIGNAKYVYEFASLVKGADIDILCDAICKTGDAEYIYKFACHTDLKSDKKALSKAMAGTGNAGYILSFAADVEDADIQVLCDGICKTDDAKFIKRFALEIKGADHDALCMAVCRVKDAKEIFDFALKVKDADIRVLEAAIGETGRYLADFAVQVEGADKKFLCNAACKSGRSSAISSFAEAVEGADLDALCRAICETNDNDAKSILGFATIAKKKGINPKAFKALAVAIARTNDSYYIYDFAVFVDDLGIEQEEGGIYFVSPSGSYTEKIATEFKNKANQLKTQNPKKNLFTVIEETKGDNQI